MQPVPWDLHDPLLLPGALEAVACGFPSPAQDYWAGDLNIGEHLVRDKAATYIWRASGHSMTAAGIYDQDLLVVDRGIPPVPGHIVVAVVDGDYTVKRLDVVAGRPVLRAESPGHADVMVAELSELSVWGVVTWVLHRTGAPHRGGA